MPCGFFKGDMLQLAANHTRKHWPESCTFMCIIKHINQWLYVPSKRRRNYRRVSRLRRQERYSTQCSADQIQLNMVFRLWWELQLNPLSFYLFVHRHQMVRDWPASDTAVITSNQMFLFIRYWYFKVIWLCFQEKEGLKLYFFYFIFWLLALFKQFTRANFIALLTVSKELALMEVE